MLSWIQVPFLPLQVGGRELREGFGGQAADKGLEAIGPRNGNVDGIRNLDIDGLEDGHLDGYLDALASKGPILGSLFPSG